MKRGSSPGLDHPGQVVQRRVDVRATDRLDERADHVVVLVAVAVVAHRGLVDGLLERRQVDRRAPLGQRGAGRRLDRGQRAPRVAVGHPQQVGAGVVVERHRAGQAALVGQRAVDQLADVVVGQRLQGQQQAARQQRRDDREERVLGGRRDQRDVPCLDGAEQRVLLGLGEAVDLVDEQHGLAAGEAEVLLGLRDDGAHVLDARVQRRHLHEPAVAGRRHDQRQRGLAGARRAEQDQRHRGVALDQAAQRRAGGRAGAPGRRPRRACAAASARPAARAAGRGR